MRFVAVAFAAAVATVLAQPHGHVHRHAAAAKRANAAVVVPGPVETVVVFELNGQKISEADVLNGIANGTLTWGEDGALTSSAVAAPTPVPTAEIQNVEEDHAPEDAPSADSPAPPAPTDQPEPTEQPDRSSPADPEDVTDPTKYNPVVDDDGNCPDCDKEFPNGVFDCDQFPVGYGAPYHQTEGLGGWSGIQIPANGLEKREVASYHDIATTVTGSCPSGKCCVPGAFCSYTCPNPYLKTSWPNAQGSKLESVGGLHCNADGKLEMGTGSLSKTLCAKGSDRMKVQVQSKLSKPVSICRTDYPGTEAETLPLTIHPGETKELANPDQSTYYMWDGKPTSAQYYINNQGVEEGRACTWGDGTGDTGNRAPVNLGTSFVSKESKGYTSLIQNKPTNPDAKLNFAIQFTGEGVQSPCTYKDGYYNGDGQGKNRDGCTAAVADHATLTIVFTDN